MLTRKQRYKPYVPDFLGLCERNYAQLQPWLPEALTSRRQVALPNADYYEISVLALARYTTTVNIILRSAQLPEWLCPHFEVRLYHDARLAEVIACKHIRRFQAVYDYPNIEMLQPDEKRQINLLLRDWLRLCRQQGLAGETLWR
jgi:hypothetical protein